MWHAEAASFHPVRARCLHVGPDQIKFKRDSPQLEKRRMNLCVLA